MNFENQIEWMKYAEKAWDAVGRPRGLDPKLVLDNPVGFDSAYYKYFEQRYLDMWLAVYSRVSPVEGIFIKRESDAFRKAWQRNFNWETIWKQLLPLFVYGTTLGAKNSILVEIASWYCIGQAIPSMVIDRILDTDSGKTFKDDAAFCMFCYTKALKGIRSLNLPAADGIEDEYVDLTGFMYERMLIEYNSRYKSNIQYITDAIRNYLLPNSRLMSSIFFGVLPYWAYLLSAKEIPAQMKDSMGLLRKVRQLNDEILDAEEDICNGLLTFPWLCAIEEKPPLRSQIKKLWTLKNKAGSQCFTKCKEYMDSSSGKQRTAHESINCLSLSMSATMESELLHNNVAFEITLLHNVRWALLNLLENVGFDRKQETVKQPCLPQETILDDTSLIAPIPGGGVVVKNDQGCVLMTLVAKRGMLRWELPAGVAKEGESLEETAKREVLEETGKKIRIGKTVALCWHHSRKLNKGWMGIFFQGTVTSNSTDDNFKVISPQALGCAKFNLRSTPENYLSVNIEDYDFNELLRLCQNCINPTSHENVIACGFVDLSNIPEGRIHPLHLDLLHDYKEGQTSIKLLESDADKDFVSYDSDTRLYYNNN